MSAGNLGGFSSSDVSVILGEFSILGVSVILGEFSMLGVSVVLVDFGFSTSASVSVSELKKNQFRVCAWGSPEVGTCPLPSPLWILKLAIFRVFL